jgi:AcrR family transcriptional regulator
MPERAPLSEFGLPCGRHVLSREDVRENQRLRLLAAVGELLVERGCGRLRSADVAARAGVSRATFYELFDDIGDCLRTALEMAADSLVDVATEACEAPVNREPRMHEAVETVLAFLDSEPAFAKLLGPAVAAAVPAGGEARDRLVMQLATLLREAPEPRATAPDGAATMEARLVEAGLSLASDHLPLETGDRRRRLAPELTALLFPAYRGG